MIGMQNVGFVAANALSSTPLSSDVPENYRCHRLPPRSERRRDLRRQRGGPQGRRRSVPGQQLVQLARRHLGERRAIRFPSMSLHEKRRHHGNPLGVAIRTGEQACLSSQSKSAQRSLGCAVRHATKEELEEIALKSTRTIELDELVETVDPSYLIRHARVQTARSDMTRSP